MTPPRFAPRNAFTAPESRYRLLPFRFLRTNGSRVFLTNECGEYHFLSSDEFSELVGHRLNRESPSFLDLKGKHFLDDGNSNVALSLLATKVRTKRSFLDGFTRLHIFVVTLRCDHTCAYCQVSRVTQDKIRFDMPMDVADTALEWAFRPPGRELKIEFQGGEPTLNFPVIRHVVTAAARRAEAEDRQVDFVIATNLSSLTDEQLAFCRDYRVHLSTSLDGPADLHNLNRPRPGQDSYDRFRSNLARARDVLGHDQVSALMTTTPAALDRVREVIDEYVSLGFDSVFLRPISPYGFATKTRLDRAYGADRFLAFYREGLAYIIELNRRGVRIMESYAQILLRKILTPFPVGYVDLQSPSGAALGALVYNYDGGVYASDESRMLAEMRDESFRLGTLGSDDYQSVMTGERVRALVENSCLETMPGCTECAYAPYCGADPVMNWATQDDIVGFRPTSEFCRRQMGLFAHLFTLLEAGDPFVRRLFLRWASQ